MYYDDEVSLSDVDDVNDHSDEVCDCGHKLSEHDRHGACTADDCYCELDNGPDQLPMTYGVCNYARL